MNGKDLLDKMSEVDPKLIEDADKAAENAAENKPKNKRALFIGIGSGMATVAAALAIAAAMNGNFLHKPSIDINNSVGTDGIFTSEPENGVQGASTSTGNNTSSVDLGVDNGVSTTGILQGPESIDIKPEEVADAAFAGYENLPIISNMDFGVHGNGAGRTDVGLYSVYDGEEPKTLETFSPWSLDAELTTLPVYLSNSTTPDADKMTERVKKAAAILGVPENDLEIVNRGLNVGDNDSYRKILEEHGLSEEEIEAELERVGRYSRAQASIEGRTSSVGIYAYTDGSIWIDFNEPNPKMPEGYDLNEQNPSPDVTAATVEYFAEEYKELLGYQKPKVARYEGNFEYKFCVYEAEEDFEAQIVNYWLNYCEFLVDWEIPNGLEMLRVHTSENLEKLGDYPIYTAQQALWVMQSDRVPEEVRIPEGAEVVKVELEYNNLVGYTAVIPYYVFTVKTDEISQFTGGLVHKYYRIPAVPEQFLDMDIEDYGVRA